MSAPRGFPHWRREFPTKRRFKAIMRFRLYWLHRSIRNCSDSSAWMPGPDIKIIEDWIAEKRKACSAKEWGR